MPSRNTIRIDAEQSYYHIYARGASKQEIFLEPADYLYFEKLFARYLSSKPAQNKQNIAYPHLHDEVKLAAYCLMPNHFHLLTYQVERGALSKLMRGIMTSYSRYFNLKYKRTGSLFENRYKSARIDQEAYLQHISRYIHLNPRYWKNYKYSSLRYYKKSACPTWLERDLVLDMFIDFPAYSSFLEDYEDHKRTLEKIKQQLASI